jgi:hypothetical protein
MKGNKIEQYYPVVCGAIAGFAYLGLFLLYPKFSLTNRFRELFVASITINAISAGFLAAAEATIISINNSKVIVWMKDTGVYETTITHFKDAVVLSLSCAVLSMLLLLIDFNNPVKYIIWGISTWFFGFTYSVLAMYRIINIFSKVLQKS